MVISNVAVVSLVVNSAPDWLVGPETIATTGGVMSPISQPNSAGVRSKLPAGPLAWTAKSCGPIARPL